PKLVRGDRRAGGAAADEHTSIGKAAEHRLTDDPRVVRVVHRIGGKAAEIQDDVSFRLERRDERRLHRETHVVATDGDAHGMWDSPPILSQGWVRDRARPMSAATRRPCVTIVAGKGPIAAGPLGTAYPDGGA